MPSYLQHYGIPGQKWGKRNGPPYPLSEGNRSLSEKKASYKEAKKGLTDKQKKAIIIGASVVATGLAAYGIYKCRNIPKSNPLTPDQMKAFGLQTFDYEKFEPERILSGSSDGLSYDQNHRVVEAKSELDKILLSANPSHGDENCTSVSLSVFLKSKGINFSSKKIGAQNLYGVIESCFKNVPANDLRESRGITKYFTSYESASSKLKEWYGDNANGVLSIPFSDHKGNTMSHTFNWSIKDGVVEFFDGQPDPPIRNITSYFKHVNVDQLLTVAHLDNLEINEQGILSFLDK